MKNVIIGAVLLMATSAWCSEFCQKLEYAELKDMSKEELIEGVKTDSTKYNNLSVGKVNPNILNNSSLYYSAIDNCLERITDYNKQLKKRYKYSTKETNALFDRFIKHTPVPSESGK
jgi:hypothetical protein